MSKDKPISSGILREKPLEQAFAEAAAGKSIANDLPTPPYPVDLTPPKKRRVRSTPLQTMARIEDIMSFLNGNERAVVFNWFVGTYGPNLPKDQP